MIFNISFKKKLNVPCRRFAWLPTRISIDPDKVIWLGFYYRTWIKVKLYRKIHNAIPMSSTDSHATYPIRSLKQYNTSTYGIYW